MIFTDNKIRNLIKCVVDALRIAQLENLVHRDIKPENILYVKNNEGEFVPVWKAPEW